MMTRQPLPLPPPGEHLGAEGETGICGPQKDGKVPLSSDDDPKETCSWAGIPVLGPRWNHSHRR